MLSRNVREMLSRSGIKSAANGAPVQKNHIVWEEYLYPLRFLLYSFQDLFRKLTLFGKNTYTPLRLLLYSFTNTKHEHDTKHVMCAEGVKIDPDG